MDDLMKNTGIGAFSLAAIVLSGVGSTVGLGLILWVLTGVTGPELVDWIPFWLLVLVVSFTVAGHFITNAVEE